MAPLEHLPVRFHFGGSFFVSNGKLEYVEGRTAMSYIELDKVSLPEIKGHLSDHMDLTNVLNLHWLRTGRELSNGLMHLLDDRYCMIMVDHISEGAIADIYVEENISNGKEESASEVNRAAIADQTDEIHVVPSSNGDDESSDEDYQQPEEQNSSADDEEAAQLRHFAYEIKMKRRAKKLGENVMPSLKNDADALVPEDVKLQNDDSPYFNSSDDYSYEDDSEGNTTRWKSVQNRFDNNAPVPIFSLGMAFISSKHFKKALVKYGLATHRHLLFPKDEKDKVKSICSWPGCKWQIYGSKTSRSEWFQVVTFVDEHNCVPRSRAFFNLGSNCDSVDNNMCESFNNSIMDSRFLPVISMNESIRCKVMVRIQENRAKVEKWQGTICPNIFKKLKLNIERSSKCYVLWNGQDGFEVQEDDKRKYTVNLDTKTCSCRYWQLSGLPCCHAISAIYKASKQIDDYIAPCYEITEYIKTYQHCLQPVEGQESWPISGMPRPLPPAYVKMPGRPKTQRTREQGEKAKGTKSSRRGIKMTCSSCQSTTHNTRTCPSKRDATQNSYIKRDATRKRRESEASTSDPMAAASTQQSSSNQTNHATKMAPRRSNSRGNTSRLAHLMFGNNY